MGEHRQKVVLVTIGLLECDLGGLLVVDIGARAGPDQDAASGISQGVRPAEVPAIGAVRTQEAVLVLKGLAGLDGVLPRQEGPLQVTGMNKLCPVHALGGPAGQAGELGPVPVEVIDDSVGPGGEDDLGHRLGQEPEPFLALSQCHLRTPILGDVLKRQENLGRGAEREATRQALRSITLRPIRGKSCSTSYSSIV